MRFYWFDGKAPQGPLDIPELLAQPGFSAETVVCPVGAERPEDWKPAVNYEPLRDALFKPKPVLIAAPPPLLNPCPSCRHPNAEDALFCSHCGCGLKEEKAPATPALPVASSLPKPPELSAGPKRSPAPSSMGRLGQKEATAKPSPIAKPPEARPPAAAPGRPAPASAAGKKTLLLAAGAFCAAFIVLAGISLWRRAAAPERPAAPPDLAPPIAAKLGTEEGSPTAAAVQPPPAPPAPPPAASPAPAAPAKPRAPARKPRARQPAVVPPIGQAPETLKPPAGPAEPSDAELGKLLQDKPTPRQPALKEPAGEVLLPGIPKKVRKVSDAAQIPAATPPAESETPTLQDKVLEERAKEQFNFCHQLMREGNFGDFFDTCLCAKSRAAAPYKGRRRVFIEKASEDPAGELGSSAEIGSVQLAGETARITAKWAKPDGPVERTEQWAVEDGLWCLQAQP